MVETGFVAESILPNLKEREWMPLGDILNLAYRRYDPGQAFATSPSSPKKAMHRPVRFAINWP